MRVCVLVCYKELSGLLDTNGQKVWACRVMNEEERFIALTVLVDIATDDILLQEEIFGPILPIVTIDNVVSAIQLVRYRLEL